MADIFASREKSSCERQRNPMGALLLDVSITFQATKKLYMLFVPTSYLVKLVHRVNIDGTCV